MKKYIVVHAGRRDDYQVALSLAENQLLEKLVTDVYFPLDKPWFSNFFYLFSNSFEKRFKQGLRSKYIYSSAHILFLSFLNMIKYDITRVKKIDNILGKIASRLSKDKNLPIISMNSYAYYAFQNNTNLKILFQFHPHPTFVKKILLEEISSNPSAEKTISEEHEFSVSETEMELLEKEIEYSDYCICASSITKKSLVDAGFDEAKIFIAPYGVDTEKFPFYNREKLNNKKFRILFLGSLNQRKGITYLIDAINQIENIELVIVGRGIYDDSLLQNANFTVVNKKNIDHNELLAEFERSDCFVLPSIIEGFGQVVLEAMSTGLPVITTENTCGPDIIENGIDGFVIPIRDQESLRNSINLLKENKSYRLKMGKSAHIKAKQYTWL
ncbi:glycosyltransferase family 4 protein, partial [uncultured Chryseobacterium sp.]